MSSRSNLQRKRRRQAKAILWDDKQALAKLTPAKPTDAEVTPPAAE